MTFALAHAVKLAYVVALVLAVRAGYHRRCWTWVGYSLLILCFGGLMTLWPAKFWTWEMYTASRNVYAVLKLLIGVEVAVHVFRAFPRAERVARVSAAILLSLTVPMIAGLPYVIGPIPFNPETYADWHLRLNTASVWLFALTALLVSFYHLPVEHWHRALLIGFTVHLVIFSLLLGSLKANSYWIADVLDRLKVFADLWLGCWWIVSARERRTAMVPAEAR